MVASKIQKFPLMGIPAVPQQYKSHYRSLRALALIFALAPLINVIPACADPSSIKKAQSQSIAAQTAITHNTANKTHFSSHIKKHLCSLGKLGTIALLARVVIDRGSYIRENNSIPQDYYCIASALLAVIGLGKNLIDEYKPSTFQQKEKVTPTISTVYTMGKISLLCLSVLLSPLFCKNPTCTKTSHFIKMFISACFTGAYGKSLYNDYKAYKQCALLHATTDKSPVASVPVKTMATHA